MTSRFNLGRDIKEISSEDIPFSRFSPPSSFRFFEERERGKGKGEVLRGHERFYVKLEEISVTRNFVCMMRGVFFFSSSSPCEMNIGGGEDSSMLRG